MFDDDFIDGEYVVRCRMCGYPFNPPSDLVMSEEWEQDYCCYECYAMSEKLYEDNEK